MAKALSLASQKPDKSMEDIFKSLSNSASRITLMMTALQKYQNMTATDAGLIVEPKLLAPESEQNLSNDEDSSGESSEPSGAPVQVISPSASPAVKKHNLSGKLTVKIVSAKNLIKSEALAEAFCVIRVCIPFAYFFLFFPFFFLLRQS
jgi:hypothetical protein